MDGNNERFKEAFEYLKYTKKTKDVTSFAKQLGRNRSYLSLILNDKVDVKDELLMLLHCKFECINLQWLLTGHGNMLNENQGQVSVVEGNNASNSIVGISNSNCSLVVGENGINKQMPNKYGDSPSEERKWAPVVPQSMAAMPDFDIIGHLTKQMTGGNIERLYSGTLDIDAWHYIPDSDIEDFCKGDCLGIKAYPEGKECIVPGKLYVIDTRLNGMLVRYLWKTDIGYSAATSKDGTRNRFDIADDDVIRIYRKLIMFRY